MRLPLVSVAEQLLLVVVELFVCEGSILVVGTLDNGVNGAGLLAVPAIDALGHIDVVSSGPSE